MLPPGAGECRKTQAAGRDRGIRHPSVFRPMPLLAENETEGQKMKVKISRKEIHALAGVALAGTDNILCKNFEYEDHSNRKFKKCIKELQPLLDRLQKKMSEPQSETIRCTRTETKINGIEGLPEGIRRELIDALQQSLCEDRQAEAETKSEEAA